MSMNIGASAFNLEKRVLSNDDDQGQREISNTERFSEMITFLTRALVKNNVVQQNSYLILLTIEYVCMMYYVLRVVDGTTLYQGFAFIENFLNIEKDGGYSEMSWDDVQKYQSGELSFNTKETNQTQTTLEEISTRMKDKVYSHTLINCMMCAVYTLFLLIFLHRIFKLTSFDKTQEQSYILKSMSSFMVLSKTVLKVPVIVSILVMVKALSLGMVKNSIFYIAVICCTALSLEFSLVVIYALKFFNLEVPNDDIAWSHNQTNGLYFKLVLNLAVCSIELYRQQLTNMAVTIIILGFIMGLQLLILLYRMNTPNIFNTIVHDYTLLLESLVLSLSAIGLIALFTQRDILSTMAYLCIFIPVIIKIFYSVDQSRKHYVLFKLKNEENLSGNEYLIAITHLLKMIRRQSETDLAQLLSFTYYHKLYCYDTGCICQFFTQYCQDPIKFKNKKKRTYRGYKDDGFKLVQQQDASSFDHLELITNGAAGDEESGHVSNSQRNRASGRLNTGNLTNEGTGQQNRQQDIMMVGIDASAIQPVTTNLDNMYDSNIDGTVQLDASQIEISGATTTNQQRQDLLDQAELSQNQNGNYGQSVEFKESGINAMFYRNQVLRGTAFNGFDSNLDFKIKGEFKSPSQFKTTYESRTYFFTRLLETMFKQLESRTKDNISFTLISIYFHFVYQHNIYLAALTLVKLAKTLNQSAFQKMTFSVTEYYLLEMIMNDFKHHTRDEIDYQTFIESSQMQQRLDWLFEDASLDIIQFWRLFKEEQANVEKAYHLAMVISKNIAMIREYTQILEEKQLIKDYNKYYYYAMFYQNLLNDRQSYNQMINNLRNLLMIRNMQRKNSRFGGNIQDINDIGFAIFALEEGGVQDRSSGKFIYCNKQACGILNISEEDILGKPGSSIMPDLIRVNHDSFVKRFFQDGLNRQMGKVRNVYIKDFNGYVKPVQFFINFYYNSKFSYSIIMHIDPILSLTYHGTSSQISTKHCMVFLCNDDGLIQNMTENSRRIIGLTHKRAKEEEEVLGRGLKIDDIIHNFLRIETTIQQNKYNFLPNQAVRVKNFRGLQSASVQASAAGLPNDISYIQCSLTYEEVVYLKGYPGQFTEKVFMIIPNTKIPELIDSSNMQSSGNGGSNNTQNNMQSEQQVNSDSQQSHSTQELGDQLTPSCSSIGSSSSVGSSTNIASTKNLMFQQKSPKILNLYLSIVFGVFISFMIIISINFIIYVQKKNNVNLQISFNQVINQRNVYLTSSLLDLRMLQLISQNQTLSSGKSNTSQIFMPPYDNNRFGKYGEFLFSDEQILQVNHQQYKQMSSRNSELTSNQDSRMFNGISYRVVSDKGVVYYQNNTLDFGIQLLISDIAMIKPQFFMNETIPMNLDSYIQNLPANKTVSQLFKNLFYSMNNGLTHINYLIRQENDYILDNTMDTSASSNLFINLISFISIGIITFIGIFTFPMLGKIEDRKISVLKFFNILSVDQIQVLIQKGEDYRDEFSSLQRAVNQSKNDNNIATHGEGSEDEEEDERMNDEYGASFVARQLSEKFGVGVKAKVQDDVAFEKVESGKRVPSKGKGSKNDLSLATGIVTQSQASMVGMRDGKSVREMSEQEKMKKRISSQNANGIRNIFKRIKENEDNIKEQQFNRKKDKYSKSNGGVRRSSKANSINGLGAAFGNKSIGAQGKAIEDELEKKKQKYKVDEEIKEEDEHGPETYGKGRVSNHGKSGKQKKLDDPSSSQKDSDDEYDDSSSDDEEDGDSSKKKKRKRKGDRRGSDYGMPLGTQNDSLALNKEQQNNRTDHISVQLEKVALQEKIKLAVYVIIVLAFLNSCLIACFSIGQKTFQEDTKAVFSLTTFYRRQNCLENLLLYSLEQFVHNRTFVISEDETDAVGYYIDYCQDQEREFNDLRRNLPVFLVNDQGSIDGLESSNICKTIYKTSEFEKIARCESVYDEIMKRGLTQTLYSIFNYAQSVNVRFQKEFRSKEFLNQFIYADQKMRDLTDLVKSYIHDSFQFIQTLVTDSTINYFNQLGTYYMIIYGCYIGVSIFMCLVFGLFIFKKLRQQIITSANVLAIMPLEEIDTRERQKIESFLNS